jgi:hypothetical protein
MRFGAGRLAGNVGIVCRALGDRMIEDGRVRGETRNPKFIDIALERAAVQRIARYVVEPGSG